MIEIIGIQKGDIPARGVRDADVTSHTRITGIWLRVDGDAVIQGGELLEHRWSTIGRTIIDHDNFKMTCTLVGNRLETVFDVRVAVKHRDDDGNFRHKLRTPSLGLLQSPLLARQRRSLLAAEASCR